MTWAIIHIAVGLAVFLMVRGIINVKARYRSGAALACAALWPVIGALIAGFLLLDAVEWGARRLRRFIRRFFQRLPLRCLRREP